MLEERPASDVLHALAMGPFKRVQTWRQIFVNGFNFHTRKHGKHKSTMNYGVCVSSADGVDYFGIVDDIIEIVYTGHTQRYKTVLFKCSWMDCGRGMNVHEQYRLLKLTIQRNTPNMNHLCYLTK